MSCGVLLRIFRNSAYPRPFRRSSPSFARGSSRTRAGRNLGTSGAIEKALELAAHEVGQRCCEALLDRCVERLEVVAHQLVERGEVGQTLIELHTKVCRRERR